MRNYHIYKIWVVYCSFIIAIIMQYISPISKACGLRPSWIMMVLIYWISVLPDKINIGTGFILGIIIDCVFGFTLGMHSLSLSILSYMIVRKLYIFRNMMIWKQSLFILFLSFIYHSTKFLVKLLITRILYPPEIFWNCILDGLIWPFFIFLMRKIY